MWSGTYGEGNVSSLHVNMKNTLLNLLGLMVVQPTHDRLIAWMITIMMMTTTMMMVSRCDFSSYVVRLMLFCAFRLMLFMFSDLCLLFLKLVLFMY